MRLIGTSLTSDPTPASATFRAMRHRALDACLIGLWVLAVVAVGIVAFH